MQIIAFVVSPVFRLTGAALHAFSGKELSLTIIEKPKQAKDLLTLFSQIRGENNLIVIYQDESFGTWAYEKGNRSYRRRYGYNGDELLAYFVIDSTDEMDFFIADFAAIDFPSFYLVWSKILTELRDAGAPYLTVAYNYRNPLLAQASRWLMCAGFIPFFRRGGFVVRNIDFHDSGLLKDISNWYITPLWVALFKG